MANLTWYKRFWEAVQHSGNGVLALSKSDKLEANMVAEQLQNSSGVETVQRM